MLKIYTDGSCTNNGRKGAKGGYAVVFPEKLEESWGDVLPKSVVPTNQIAELTAILEGLKKGTTIMGDPAEITVHVFTDSDYSINCLTKWVSGWKKRDWKTADGKPVVHREIIEKILEQLKLYSGHVFVHVKAHTGGTDENSKWNGEADELARKAVEDSKEVKYADFKEVVKVVRNTDATEHVLTGIPLAIMGGPISEKVLVEAIRLNLDSLDPTALKNGLIAALKKTLALRKFDLEKTKIFKTPHYKLIEENHLTINRLDDTNE
jgi:ribonuclease HI